jgi:hypothetical protein
MANSQNGQTTKHFSGFWPIFIIVIVAAIAAFTIYMFASGNIIQDQIYSTSFWNWGHHPTVKKATGKIQPKSTIVK